MAKQPLARPRGYSRQLWLALLTATLMGSGVALALRALQIEDSLNDRYDEALTLAEESLEVHDALSDLRVLQARYAASLAERGADSQSADATLRATLNAGELLGQKVARLRRFNSSAARPHPVDRIDRVIESLARTNVNARAALRTEGSDARRARDELLQAAESQFETIDLALNDLLKLARNETAHLSQRARGYSTFVRQSLIALSAAALLLGALLGWLNWRSLQANARLLGQMSQLAHQDGLTGAVNRRGLDERLPQELARANRLGYPLTVAMLDLDHFKRFNDRRGHAAGDNVLRGAVAAWQTRLRPMDLLARYGGEEFTLVLPACDADEACALLERLRPLVPDRQTFSAGVATWSTDDSAEELLRSADAALLQAKRTGRNRTIVWGREPQMTLPLKLG